jgi:hypothetical protein
MAALFARVLRLAGATAIAVAFCCLLPTFAPAKDFTGALGASGAVFDDKLGPAKQYALGLSAAAYGRRFADLHSDRFEPKRQSG